MSQTCLRSPVPDAAITELPLPSSIPHYVVVSPLTRAPTSCLQHFLRVVLHSSHCRACTNTVCSFEGFILRRSSFLHLGKDCPCWLILTYKSNGPCHQPQGSDRDLPLLIYVISLSPCESVVPYRSRSSLSPDYACTDFTSSTRIHNSVY